jgi:FAD/FMN-containing dehydrogenase
VYDMTEFIASGEHPGGEEIPLKYGGRDATEYWHELHGHIESEIAADIESGEGDNTFLEVLPRCIGRTSGHTPVEARVYSSWRERNWAGNVWWPAAAAGQQLVEPASLEELCEVVKNADAVRVLGRGHSFVPLCPVEEGGVMISLNQMSAVLELDETNMTVTVEGGITYSQLVGYLSSEERPYSLANVQSHPGFTVAGTLATASHGSSALDPASGRAWLGGQASLARSCLMVLADGTTRRFSPGDAAWHAAIVNLGCLGVMAEVTLDLVPDHDYELVMYRRLLLSAARVTCSLSTDSDDLTL